MARSPILAVHDNDVMNCEARAFPKPPKPPLLRSVLEVLAARLTCFPLRTPSATDTLPRRRPRTMLHGGTRARARCRARAGAGGVSTGHSEPTTCASFLRANPSSAKVPPPSPSSSSDTLILHARRAILRARVAA